MQLSIIFLVVSSHLVVFSLAIPIFTEMKSMDSAASPGEYIYLDENPSSLNGVNHGDIGSFRETILTPGDGGFVLPDENPTTHTGTNKGALDFLDNAIPIGGGGSTSRGRFGFGNKSKVTGLANGDIGLLSDVIGIGADDSPETILNPPEPPM